MRPEWFIAREKNRSSSSHPPWESYGLVFTLLLPLVAGPAFGAEPIVRKLLPETAVFDRVDGQILHVDVNDTWLFELTAEGKTPEFQVPPGARFVLLPSATLARLIADVNDRYTPRYRLSARVTRYKGANYLFPTYYLPLSTFKEDTSPEDRGRKAEVDRSSPKSKTEDQRVEEPEFAIPPEVLEQLKKQRPPRGPRRGFETGKPPAPGARERVLVDSVGLVQSCRPPVAGPELADPGSRLADPNGPPAEDSGPPIPGDDPTGMIFVPYALGWNLSDVRYVLLPCTVLEQTEQRQAWMPDRIRFSVAGLVTEFKGKKYLLPQRAALVYNYGNFGR
jgi:hypothetical protein